MECPPFKDRTLRLSVFGSLAILVGFAWVLLSLLGLGLLVAGGLADHGAPLLEPRSVATGVALQLLVAAAFVWVGVGSIRRRRWARPLMLTLAWTWLGSGAGALVLLPSMLDGALGSAAVEPGVAAVTAFVRFAVLTIAAVVGVVVPTLFVWVYNDRNLQRTCEAHDLARDWTARCPPVVLGLSVSLAACGAIGLLKALQPVVPLFGGLLTGWNGALVLIAGAGTCFWLARETYRLTQVGWWATSAFLLLVGVSTWWTLLGVEPETLYLALGYPEGASLPSASFVPAAAWLTGAVTLLTVAYMARIRKHFTERSSVGVPSETERRGTRV